MVEAWKNNVAMEFVKCCLFDMGLSIFEKVWSGVAEINKVYIDFIENVQFAFLELLIIGVEIEHQVIQFEVIENEASIVYWLKHIYQLDS